MADCNLQGENSEPLRISRISCEEALREYFRIVGEYEDQLRDDELVDDLPQSKLENFLDWLEPRGGAILINEVIECLKIGHDAVMTLRLASCYSSRRGIVKQSQSASLSAR